MAALHGSITSDTRQPVTRTAHQHQTARLKTWSGEAVLTVWADGRATLEVGHPVRGNHAVVWSGNVEQADA